MFIKFLNDRHNFFKKKNHSINKHLVQQRAIRTKLQDCLVLKFIK